MFTSNHIYIYTAWAGFASNKKKWISLGKTRTFQPITNHQAVEKLSERPEKDLTTAHGSNLLKKGDSAQ
ncbi:MAG: hypothetical protein ACPIA2_02490 [Mariniblastus sp.]